MKFLKAVISYDNINLSFLWKLISINLRRYLDNE